MIGNFRAAKPLPEDCHESGRQWFALRSLCFREDDLLELPWPGKVDTPNW